MDALLPDELLHEILSYNVKVLRSDFLELDRDRHRWVVGPSRNSDLLLVSKRWLRIGTPLLYECLQLTKPEHTSSVATLFRAQPNVGLAVRCLRLQGGLGRDLVHVAKYTPKLQHLLLDPQIKSADSIAGLKKAFPLFRASDLYLESDLAYWRHNKKVIAAWQLLYAYMREGTFLRTLVLADHFRAMNNEFVDALAASSIEEISCDTHRAEEYITSGHMRRIIGSPRLQRVVCRGALAPERTHDLLRTNGFSAADVLKFSIVEGPRDAHWRRIFRAMDEAEAHSSSDSDSDSDEDA
ncbi:hypothetical protein PsYK624_139310 [Phanerochaete sordida]|uniref:Uncharacterized protein n=1 Tax=Phanerochaete sordida TaxID=48140 RepID=A0A9P3GQJ6_9APHY|nr:hypothetical protein PsYK624_139310 [Phanerochaete sordida]